LRQHALVRTALPCHVDGMPKLLTILLMVARLLGVILILLGAAIWFGFGAGITATHAILGSLFVLDAWIIAIIALFALPSRTMPLLVLVLGGVVAWFGGAQTTLLVGNGHWAVRLLHLLLGVALLGLIESLAKAVRLHRRTVH
jgi:hypothetical protein